MRWQTSHGLPGYHLLELEPENSILSEKKNLTKAIEKDLDRQDKKLRNKKLNYNPIILCINTSSVHRYQTENCWFLIYIRLIKAHRWVVPPKHNLCSWQPIQRAKRRTFYVATVIHPKRRSHGYLMNSSII